MNKASEIMSEDMQQISKRYETNNGCETARTKWTFKTRQTNKKFIYYNNKTYINT